MTPNAKVSGSPGFIGESDSTAGLCTNLEEL
jgi:hypothetical protein